MDELSFKINIHDPGVQEAIKSKDSNGNYLTMDEIKSDKIIDKNGVEIPINLSGEFAGTIKMNNELDKYKNQVGELANGIANGVNTIYKDLDGDGVLSAEEEAGTNLYEVEVDADGNFVSVKVNGDIEKDPSKLQMTADKALKLYNLKDDKITFGKAPDEKEMTINNFYNNMLQELGQSSQTVIREEKNQSKLLGNIDSSRLSVSGVSMDEEMVNLIQFQHSYNASAKVISTIDSLLDVVINGLVR